MGMDLFELALVAGAVFGLVTLIAPGLTGKFLKVKAPRNVGLLLLIVCGVGGIWVYNWGGFRTQYLEGVGGVTPEPVVTQGIQFEAEGSESDANLSYDAASRTFTCSFIENKAVLDNIVATTSPYASITTVTFTITVFRTDLLALSENAVARISVAVPKFYGKSGTENESVPFAPIAKATDDKYNVTITPVGVGVRNEYNYFSVGSGGSKAITLVATISNRGLSQLDNFDSTTVPISISGLSGDFYLRFVKTGEVAA
jgi:hypothetical protein